jgi:D-xylose transport system substrate-binding protein
MIPASEGAGRRLSKATVVSASALACAAALAIAGCSSSSSTTTSTSTTAPPSSAPATSASASASSAAISVSSLTVDFSAMSGLSSVASAGKGSIAVILPDTVTSARYTEFDAPYLTKALTTAGLSSSDFTVQNAQGSDTTEFTDAQQAITKGASVLIMDPLDPGVGARIEAYGKQHGVPVIDYDRLTAGGSRNYYVSFDNVKVGTLIGQGFQACAQAWHVAKPNVLVMSGAPTDNNATLFAQGYNGVLNPLFSAGTYVKVGATAGTWDPPTALTEFQQQYTAHRNMNAVLVPNDANAAPIITYLQRQGVKPNTFPVTGQDASLVGLQNVLAGYQCGTVYKPIYAEAQAAAALALFLRASQTPPASLVNSSVTDPKENSTVPSVLLTPTWVTTQNMNSTVITDKFVLASQLCTGQYAAACSSAGISG